MSRNFRYKKEADKFASTINGLVVPYKGDDIAYKYTVIPNTAQKNIRTAYKRY